MIRYKNVDNESETTAVDFPSYPDYSGYVRQISYASIAQFIHENYYTISFNDKIYIYHDGIYSLEKGEINQKIKQILDQTQPLWVKCPTLTNAQREIRAHLLTLGFETEYPFNQYSGIIPVQNGIISLNLEDREEELLPYDPSYNLTYKLPVYYDSEADSNSITKIMNDWLADQAFIIPQIVGQAIFQLQGNVYKQSYMFLGKGNAGKSQCIDFLHSFFGNDLVSKISIHQVVGNQFSASNLEGKALNLSDDASSIQLKESEKFKDRTGTQWHMIEKKYHDPYLGIANPVYVMACNKPPKIDLKNIDVQFLERWNIAEFNNSFPINQKFKELLFTEENYSALLNLAIQSMFDIHFNGICKIDRDDSNEFLWVMKYTPLYNEFISKYMVKDSNGSIDKDALYMIYNTVCNQIGWKTWDKSVFFKELIKYGIKSARISSGDRKYIIPGWSLNTDAMSDRSE